MRKLAVWVLVAAFVAALAPVVTAGPAAAAPGPAPAAGPAWLRLTLDSLRPTTVTGHTTSVTVTGRITNISDRGLHRLTARLQLGDALAEGTDVRAALRPTASYSHSDTVFRPLTDFLAPGQSRDFTVHEPVTGPESLRIGEAGVYPLMINIQGVPDYSTPYRLVVGTMLLPVLAPPGGHPPAAGPAGPLTVLWPLVGTRPSVVGSAGGREVLSDDGLATSLAPGGRLFGLVDSVRQAATGDPALLTTLCFAVDPDLLATVRSMAGGYRVRTASGTTAGRGAAAAAAWLAMLKGLTTGHCVLPLPYADADLVALNRTHGSALLRLALSQSTAVAGYLGAARLADVVWPADNALDPATITELAGLGMNTVLLDQDSVRPADRTGPASLAGFTGAAAPKVVPIDHQVAAAMAPRTDEPTVDDAGVSAQDGLGATIYRTVFAGTGEPLLVAPPRRWSPSAEQAAAFLAGLTTVLGGHYATPAALGDAVGAVPAGRPVRPVYPRSAVAAEVTQRVATAAVRTDGQQRDVQRAMTPDRTKPNPVRPSQLITPLRLGVLRGVSTAWRGDEQGALAALAADSREFEDLAAKVSLVQHNLPILLGSRDSKLPVTVNNGLPVDVAVRVDLTGDAGLPSGSTEDVIPAGASLTVFVSTSIARSGRISAYATVRTPGGTQFGQQARLELVSSRYGTIIVIVTALAFALLVLLSGRRIYRRVRASRAAETQPLTGTRSADPPVGALVGAGKAADRRTREQQEPDER